MSKMKQNLGLLDRQRYLNCMEKGVSSVETHKWLVFTFEVKQSLFFFFFS